MLDRGSSRLSSRMARSTAPRAVASGPVFSRSLIDLMWTPVTPCTDWNVQPLCCICFAYLMTAGLISLPIPWSSSSTRFRLCWAGSCGADGVPAGGCVAGWDGATGGAVVPPAVHGAVFGCVGCVSQLGNAALDFCVLTCSSVGVSSTLPFAASLRALVSWAVCWSDDCSRYLNSGEFWGSWRSACANSRLSGVALRALAPGSRARAVRLV